MMLDQLGLRGSKEEEEEEEEEVEVVEVVEVVEEVEVVVGLPEHSLQPALALLLPPSHLLL